MEEEIIIQEPLHPLTACVADYSTEKITSVVSYIHTCPECGNSRRYAIPKEGDFVGCDGNDLGVYSLIPNVE